ncbi:MAG: flagellar basal-body rod protein FlgF [Alphaproteobacteria bacterium]
MENSLYIGLSRQMVLRNNMSITANNIANMNTPGFRAQNLMFMEYISDPKNNQADPMSFVYDRGQYQNTDEGPVEQTNNPFDIALVGPGFFGVDGPGEAPTYSRAGNLHIGVDGTLMTSGNFPVVDEGGAPINIPADATEIKIDDKGVISTQNGQIGRIQIVEFENVQELEAFGNNLYTTDAVANPATQTKVKQGYIEGSNVNSIIEMTRLIEVSRSFQSIQSSMSKENERLLKAIQKLTKV